MKRIEDLTASEFLEVDPQKFEEWKKALLGAIEKRNIIIPVAAFLFIFITIFLVTKPIYPIIMGPFIIVYFVVLGYIWREPDLLAKQISIDWAAIRRLEDREIIEKYENHFQKMTQSSILFSFEGRISRSIYWLRGWLPLSAMLLLGIVSDIAISGKPNIVSIIFALLTFWPFLAITVKRLHDHYLSGWFVLLALVPLIGQTWLFLDILLFKGTQGVNRFGSDPLKKVT